MGETMLKTVGQQNPVNRRGLGCRTAALSDATAAYPQSNWHWTGYSFTAMNTTVQTWLYSQTDSSVLLDVQRLFNSFEKRLSRFDANSELARLNASEQEVFRASPTLLDAVEIALLAAQATGGLYDPTILNDLEQAGYDRSFEKIDQAAPIWQIPAVSPNGPVKPAKPGSLAFRAVYVNRARREIYKPHGLRLDLGGMGKGWTVVRAADRLQGLGPYLINAGGDIFGYNSPPGQKGWQIDVVHPLKPEQFMVRVYLHHRALATSTIAKRRWQRNGQIFHHLIDPRTGQPSQTDAVSVSVVADRTVMAEIYAKVALILGAEHGISYLADLPGVEGLFYTAQGEILYTAGFEAILCRVEPAGYSSSGR